MRLLLSLAIIGALGYGGMQLVGQLQQQPPQVAAGLKPVEVSGTAAKSFDDKIAALQASADQAKRTGRTAPVEVTFTEQELTSKLAEAGQLVSGIATTDTQIHLSGGNVIATTRVNVQGIDVNVGVVATPVVEAGQAKLVVKDVQTGGIPIPEELRKQIAAQLGQAIDPSALGLPFEVSGIRIVDGKVVISGTAKP